MDGRPLAHLTDTIVTDLRSRRGILGLAAGSGAGVASFVSAVDGDGVPTDEVLAAANLGEVPDNTDTPVTYGVLFDPPASVVKGEQYALVVTETASQISYSIAVHDGNVCAGEMFSDDFATGTFEPVPGIDLIFAVSITSAG
jgi:hypothetical protein